MTWIILAWTFKEPLGGSNSHDLVYEVDPPLDKAGSAGPGMNIFDVLLCMMLGAWLVILIYGITLNGMPVWDAFSSMLREHMEWVGEERVVTPEIRIISEVRFPSYRELVEWSNQRVPEGTTRSPQIGHGWTEYSPVNWDWPEPWR